VDRFGSSAPGKVMMHEYGFTVDHVYERAMKLVQAATSNGVRDREETGHT